MLLKGLVRVATIFYVMGSSLNRAFEAHEMMTVTLFDEDGRPKSQRINLRQPLSLYFKQAANENSTCAFYDIAQLKWSQDGCFLSQGNKKP